MTVFEATLLALVQGITEFLPISSSAHLILMPYLLGWEDHDLTFDIVTNAGTLLAAMFYFRGDLMDMVKQQQAEHRGSMSLLPWKVGLATVPILVFGLTFYDWISTTARLPIIIATTTLIFGLLLSFADRFGQVKRELADVGWLAAVLIGCAQAVALIPGTSRSGITITAALLLGYTRKDAARFSFLLAIPVGLLAFAHDLLDLWHEGLRMTQGLSLLIGFVVSALSAYLVIDWLLRWLEGQTLHVFVVYRVILALLIYGVVFWR